MNVVRIQKPGVRIQNKGGQASFWILFLCLAFLVLVPAFLWAEIIDRIAITVGNQVITESQIEVEIRVTAFLNHQKVDLSDGAKEDAAQRLIEQALIKREMDLSRYPLPDEGDAGKSLDSLKAMYASEAEFQNELKAYDITANELTRRLWWQLTLLRFIDYRFRPGIQIPAADVQAYYRQHLSEWQQKGTKAIPTLEESRGQIEEILTQQRIDQALDQWLKDMQNQVTIRYLDPKLRSTAPSAAPNPVPAPTSGQ